MKVVCFGAFDERASPRVRLLREGLQLAGIDLVDCRATGPLVPRYARLARQLPRAVRRADLLLVAKPGQREMPLATAAARMLGLPLVLDYFASLWVNEVRERQRVAPGTAAAWKLALLDRFAWRAADRCLVDTHTHGRMIATALGATTSHARRVFVGAEEQFRPLPSVRRTRTLEALFVGTFIPFHGIEVLLEAAALLRDEPHLRIVLLGDGQTRAAMERRAAELALPNVSFEAPIAYADLPERMARADLCLGLFGTSETARAVIPKKVFAALACGKPVVTGDSEGIREALDERTAYLCPPGDAAALAATLRRALADKEGRAAIGARGRALHERCFTAAAIGASALSVLHELVAPRVLEPVP